jgi:hypothetical protein
MELREKVAALVKEHDERAWEQECAENLADRILAIPEIANALEAFRAQTDALFGGTGFVRITRIDPEEVRPNPPA